MGLFDFLKRAQVVCDGCSRRIRKSDSHKLHEREYCRACYVTVAEKRDAALGTSAQQNAHPGDRAVDRAGLLKEQNDMHMMALFEELRARMPEQQPEVDHTCLTQVYFLPKDGWFIAFHVKDGTCWIGNLLIENNTLCRRIYGRITHEDALRLEAEDRYAHKAICEIADNGWQLKRDMREIVFTGGDKPCLCYAARYEDVKGAWHILRKDVEIVLPSPGELRADLWGCAERFTPAIGALLCETDAKWAAAILYAYLHGLLKHCQVCSPKSRQVKLFKKEYSVQGEYFPVCVEVCLSAEKAAGVLACVAYSMDMRGGGFCSEKIAEGDDLFLLSPIELMERYETQITTFTSRFVPSFSMKGELEAMKQ